MALTYLIEYWLTTEFKYSYWTLLLLWLIIISSTYLADICLLKWKGNQFAENYPLVNPLLSTSNVLHTVVF